MYRRGILHQADEGITRHFFSFRSMKMPLGRSAGR